MFEIQETNRFSAGRSPKERYVAPSVEAMAFEVEAGFAQSGKERVDAWNNDITAVEETDWGTF